MEIQQNRRTFISWEGIKQTVLSIIIGAAISLITLILQEAINYLKSLDPAIPGVMAGIGRQLVKWRFGRFS